MARGWLQAGTGTLLRVGFGLAAFLLSAAIGAGAAPVSSRIPGTLAVRGGGIAADLSRAGVTIHAGEGSLSLLLVGAGRGTHPDPVAPVIPLATSDGASYLHPGLVEWYRGSPLGVEQGFDLTRRPAGTGPVTLVLRVGGSLHPRQAGATVLFERGARGGLRYGGVLAVDATGRRLQASLAAGHGLIRLRVADRGARYPLLIDPFILQTDEFTATDSSVLNFGSSVALSGDGNSAYVGGYGSHNGDGQAWTFRRDENTWTQQENSTGSLGSSGAFGTSVAMSADGRTILTGGYNSSGGAGAVMPGFRLGDRWIGNGGQFLTGVNEVGAGHFGSSVALSADGRTALVGGDNDNSGAGAAWLFTRTGTTYQTPGSIWTAGPKLNPTGELGNAHFGESVALSADGNTALITGSGDNGGKGAAWVFVRSGNNWTQQAKLIPTDESGLGQFGGHYDVGGDSAALSADGNTALVGALQDGGGIGAAWVFTRSGGIWTQQGAKLAGSGETGAGEFGESVALAGDGNTALIGGPFDNGGSVWLFTRSGGTWAQQGSKVEGNGFRWGKSVALSEDGRTALVGDAYVADGYVSPLAVGPATTGPTSLAFGSQTIGQGGEVKWLPVENNGTSPLVFTSAATISGPNQGDFTIPAGDDLCDFTTLDTGSICWIGVRFAPTAAGAESATMTLGGGNLADPAPTFALTGTGIAALQTTHLLATPFRAYDSRTDQAGPLQGGAIVGTAGPARPVQIVGVVPGVPANATAVVGVITVTQEAAAAGGGFATVWPSGAWPGTSNINYQTADVANSFTCALSGSGSINIAVSVTTHVVIDITGYIS